MMTVYILDPRCTPEHLGLIPGFLDDNDPRPAAVQFDEKYCGGWRNQKGFTMVNYALHFRGDPPFKPIAVIDFRHEKVFIYEYGYVSILQDDGTFEACRLD